jgi:hypothetical protein
MTAGGTAGSTNYCASMTGNIASGGYGGMGTNLSPAANTGVDLTGYTGVEFYAKGSGNYWFQLTQPSITGSPYGYAFTATSTWTKITVYFATNLSQRYGGPDALTLNSIIALQWANNANGAMDLQIDDIKLLLPAAAKTPTNTPTLTATTVNSFTFTQTNTTTRTFTPTNTPTFTFTTINSSTSTPTSAISNTFTNTETTSPTFTTTLSATMTMNATNTASPSQTVSFTVTFTPSVSATYSNSATQTNTLQIVTPTFTQSITVTLTSTPSVTNTATITNSTTATSTNTPPQPTSTFTLTVTKTFSYTQTATHTSTPTKTITGTATITNTVTVTPDYTVVPVTSIEPIYPNPYTPGSGGLKMDFNINKPSPKVKFRLFSIGYRLIREYEWDNLPAGHNTEKVQDSYIDELSSGIYYYIVTYADIDGNEKRFKPKTLIILRK